MTEPPRSHIFDCSFVRSSAHFIVCINSKSVSVMNAQAKPFVCSQVVSRFSCSPVDSECALRTVLLPCDDGSLHGPFQLDSHTTQPNTWRGGRRQPDVRSSSILLREQDSGVDSNGSQPLLVQCTWYHPLRFMNRRLRSSHAPKGAAGGIA